MPRGPTGSNQHLTLRLLRSASRSCWDDPNTASARPSKLRLALVLHPTLLAVLVGGHRGYASIPVTVWRLIVTTENYNIQDHV
jgi:hypothetical protein